MYLKRTAAVMFLGGVALAGCDVNIHEGKASVGVRSAEATNEWTHHYPLSAGGLVEIVNINGPVIVTQGPVGDVEVHAKATARTLTEAAARDILAKGSIQELTEPARIHVETMRPRGVGGTYTVSYDVRVPPGARIDVSANSGSFHATGLDGNIRAACVNSKMELLDISGGVDAIVANGSLTARFSSITDTVKLEVNNGSLNLELPAASKARLAARVVNGAFTVSGLNVDAPDSHQRIKNIDTVLNGGGPEISARVTNGRLIVSGK
jgi:hypothetical protein